MANVREEVCRAIQTRALLSFTYEGLPRVVIPCALGQHKSTGNLLLRSFQVRGTTESGSLPLWRLYDLSAVSRLEVLSESFEDAPAGYRRSDRAFAAIICQL